MAFDEWLKELTRKGTGVTQRQVAEAAGTTPQAVTKWRNGGGVEIEQLARLAAWTNLSVDALRRLVDEKKLRVAGVHGAQNMQDLGAPQTDTQVLKELWNKLDRDRRRELLGMAKTLAAQQKKRGR